MRSVIRLIACIAHCFSWEVQVARLRSSRSLIAAAPCDPSCDMIAERVARKPVKVLLESKRSGLVLAAVEHRYQLFA